LTELLDHFGADCRDGGDDDRSNQGGEQALFDGGGAGFIICET